MDQTGLTAIKDYVQTLEGTQYRVEKLTVPPWMRDDYTGEQVTREERKTIRNMALRLRGLPSEHDSNSESSQNAVPDTDKDSSPSTIHDTPSSEELDKEETQSTPQGDPQ